MIVVSSIHSACDYRYRFGITEISKLLRTWNFREIMDEVFALKEKVSYVQLLRADETEK